jgi:hypothetical protein
MCGLRLAWELSETPYLLPGLYSLDEWRTGMFPVDTSAVMKSRS